jgi:hypothetical protein
MARVKVRDQYQAEHWIDEAQLAFEPWRSYEVLEREGDQPAVETPEPEDAGTPKTTRKAASRPASDVKEQVVVEKIV